VPSDLSSHSGAQQMALNHASAADLMSLFVSVHGPFLTPNGSLCHTLSNISSSIYLSQYS